MEKGTLVSLKETKFILIDDESLNLKKTMIRVASGTTGVVLDEVNSLNYVAIRVTLDNIIQAHGKKNKSNLPKIHIDFSVNVDNLNTII